MAEKLINSTMLGYYDGKIKNWVEGKISGIAGAMHFIAVLPKTATDDTFAKALATYKADHTTYVEHSGDVFIFDVKEFVFDGTKFCELGDETLYATKAELATVDTKATNAGTAAASAASAASAAQTTADNAASAASAAATAAATADTKATNAATAAASAASAASAADTKATNAATAAAAAQSDVDALETIVGNTTLETTAKTVTAAVNELKTRIDSSVGANDSTITLKYTNAAGTATSIDTFTLNQASDKGIVLYDIITEADIDALFA